MFFLLFPPYSLTFFGAAVSHASSSVIGISPLPILSRSPSDSIQISANLIPSTDAFIHPQCALKLAAFKLPTLMRISQQGCLASALETLATDVWCVQETRIQDCSFVIRLTSPSTRSVKFHLRLSGDLEAADSVVAGVAHVAGVGVALSEGLKLH